MEICQIIRNNEKRMTKSMLSKITMLSYTRTSSVYIDSFNIFSYNNNNFEYDKYMHSIFNF